MLYVINIIIPDTEPHVYDSGKLKILVTIIRYESW